MRPTQSSISPTQHLVGAKENLAFADALALAAGDKCCIRWAITALFYSSVHATRAYLSAAHGVSVTSHEQMRSLEERYPELKKRKGDYHELQEQSHSARYYLNDRFTWDDYQELRKTAARVLSTWENKVTARLALPR